MLRRVRVSLLFLCLVLLVMVSARPVPVRAQTDVTSVSIIAAVNALRGSLRLPPYQVDPYLMSYAQKQAEYQAKINSLTHTHSDGSRPSQSGILENVAYSSIGSLTVETLITKMWSDTTHTKTLIGYHAGTIGVGVASNADNTYVSLDIRPNAAPTNPVTPAASATLTITTTPATPASAAIPVTPGASADTPAGAATTTPGSGTKAPTAIQPTGTPDTTGALIHVVSEGQTLWSIAVTYGTTINEIRSLNDLPAGFTNIIPGQKLIVQLAPTATATLPATPTLPATATATAEPPTQTPLPPTAAYTPTQMVTFAPIPATAEPPSTFPMLPLLAAALILLGAGGFVFARRLGSAN